MTIKQYHEGSRTVVLRTGSYGSILKRFDDLFTEAQKDFPSLKRDDVEIKQYGGDRIKHIFGIEFTAPKEVTVPDSYERIHQLELTL
jgi:hypothetical protein